MARIEWAPLLIAAARVWLVRNRAAAYRGLDRYPDSDLQSLDEMIALIDAFAVTVNAIVKSR